MFLFSVIFYFRFQKIKSLFQNETPLQIIKKNLEK